jgi:hypothetical protein
MEDAFGEENLFQLTKTSFLTVGGITNECVKLLPAKSMTPQLLVIGDARGVIYITKYNKTEPEILTRTNQYPKEISCIRVLEDTSLNEKIYFSVGNSIFQTNKKYDHKFKIEFNMADDIKNFLILDKTVWAITNNQLIEYEFGEITVEKSSYVNDTPITTLTLCFILGKTDPFVIIGTEDSKIKFLKGGECKFTIAVKGNVTCLSLLRMSNYDNSEDRFLFGTTSGTHGILKVNSIDKGKIIYENNVGRNLSEVVDIKMGDINLDNKNEMVLIRSDGRVEIYSINDDSCNIICKYDTQEHLTGLDIGKFKVKDKTEIILSSLSGLVFSLCPNIQSNKQKFQTIDKKTLTKNLFTEEQEVSTLHRAYDSKLEEFNKKQSNANQNPSIKNSYKIDVKNLILNKKESVFELNIYSEFPMDMAIIHCEKARLDILEVKTKDASLNVLDESLDQETKEHTKFLATMNFKEATHRLYLIIRTYEGVTDNINVTIIPANKPKTAQIVRIPIYALSFHKKYEPEYDDTDNNAIPLEEDLTNTLIGVGMTQSEFDQILHLIIPNLPVFNNEDDHNYILRSIFLNTLVDIKITRFNCEIRATSLSTLITLKEQITYEANLRKKNVQFNTKFKPASVFKILEILNPKIEKIFNLEKEYTIIKAFKELGTNVQLNDLPEEYIKILSKAHEIESNYSKRTINLHYYKSIVEQLLIDIRKVQNIDDFEIKKKDINDVFEDYTYEKIVDVFKFLED